MQMSMSKQTNCLHGSDHRGEHIYTHSALRAPVKTNEHASKTFGRFPGIAEKWSPEQDTPSRPTYSDYSKRV